MVVAKFVNVYMSGERGKGTVIRPYRRHLTSDTDLKTSYEAYRAGFVSLALEKNRRATPYVAEARALKFAAQQARNPSALLKMTEIRPALLAAAGISDKASKHLNDSDKMEAIAELIRTFLEPSGEHFVEELVFRFLLTRGDALGGSMRNVGGFLAQCKLSRAILASLKLRSANIQAIIGKQKEWQIIDAGDEGIEREIRGISWNNNNSSSRTLIFNLGVPFIGNNVDLCLFGCSGTDFSKNVVHDPSFYVALGELKGGIDPAGADEHWKTAASALDRIHKAFTKAKQTPHLFYVGAAIEAAMAGEIWSRLESGWLTNAANLTSEDQSASIAQWLCSI